MCIAPGRPQRLPSRSSCPIWGASTELEPDRQLPSHARHQEQKGPNRNQYQEGSYGSLGPQQSPKQLTACRKPGPRKALTAAVASGIFPRVQGATTRTDTTPVGHAPVLSQIATEGARRRVVRTTPARPFLLRARTGRHLPSLAPGLAASPRRRRRRESHPARRGTRSAPGLLEWRECRSPTSTRRKCLCLAAQGGDRKALGELLRRHGPRLYRAVLLPRLGSAAAAEEALSLTLPKGGRALRTVHLARRRALPLAPRSGPPYRPGPASSPQA